MVLVCVCVYLRALYDLLFLNCVSVACLCSPLSVCGSVLSLCSLLSVSLLSVCVVYCLSVWSFVCLCSLLSLCIVRCLCLLSVYVCCLSACLLSPYVCVSGWVSVAYMCLLRVLCHINFSVNTTFRRNNLPHLGSSSTTDCLCLPLFFCSCCIES